MSNEQQPRAEWIFPAQKNNNRGHLRLIIWIIAAALVIVAVALFLFLPRDQRPVPAASESPSPTDTTGPVPEPSPVITAPSIPNPDIETFTAQVQPRLDDAVRGLDLVAANLDVAAQIVDSLQQDAEVLSDTPAPSSLTDRWNAALTEYAKTLSNLRSAVDSGTDAQPSLNGARASLNELRALTGL